MTIACGLAWSNALMSIGQFILAGNWLLEGRFLQKWENFTRNKEQQLLLSFLPVVLIGFLWTENFEYALKDARIKFPLFLLPFVIGSSSKIEKKEWKILLFVYLATLVLLYLSSLGKYFGLFNDHEIQDKRELSIFISHIRYGLNLLMGSLLAFFNRKIFGDRFQYAMVLISLILFSSLLILQLYTALGIGLIIIGISLLIQFNRIKNRKIRITALGLSLMLGLILIFFVKAIYSNYHQLPEMQYDQNDLKPYSSAGNPYDHDTEVLEKENGVYVWRYVQESELKEEWNSRSEFKYGSEDRNGNPIRKTLVRFLSSKGFKKDAEGVKALEKEEIVAIENGIPNRYYMDHWPIQNRIYTTFYEIDNYQQFGYAEGFSMGMRLEYWKTAWKIIAKHPWLGVGTGDVQDAFDLQYYQDQSGLSQKSRRRAHNQFLTIWLTLGVGGLIYFLIYLFYPLKITHHTFYPYFLAIAVLSFLGEDTLETQAGVTFFAYFNSLLLLGYQNDTSSE